MLRVLGIVLTAFVLWLFLPTATASAAPVSAGASVVTQDLLPGDTTTEGETTTDDGTGSSTTTTTPVEDDAAGPQGPKGPQGTGADGSVSIELDDLTEKPNTSVTLLIGLTLLSLLPAIVLTCTSFTKILVVLGLTRNALGLQQTPPNQVLAGLALFLSLFIMGPVLGDIYEDGIKPYMDGDKTTSAAIQDGGQPLRDFMLEHTDDDELKLLINVADQEMPDSKADVEWTTLIPAFVLSELKQAFIIGFIIFIPFLVIDIVVSGALMALGMMMMPPVMVSLPFKLLLFVLVDGWALVIKSLVASYG
jgi:flagellar biosynthetic protein FliP